MELSLHDPKTSHDMHEERASKHDRAEPLKADPDWDIVLNTFEHLVFLLKYFDDPDKFH